jgi:hypothetical protein
MYRPLPPFLEIRRSPIDGHGLFTTELIAAGTELGITHVKDERFENSYIRTPLGGFFNHSESPNCEAYLDEDLIRLRSLRHIAPDEEITVRYWLYDIGEESNDP